jgi:hypothetical protein
VVSSVSSSLSVVASPFCVPEIGGVWTRASAKRGKGLPKPHGI